MGGTMNFNCDPADYVAILQVLARYCRGVDRLDPALVESAYWEDSFDDHGPFKGTGAEIAAQAIHLLRETFDSHTHLIGQSLIDVRGDRAAVETSFVAYSAHKGGQRRGGPHVVTMIGGRYSDLFAKRAGEWRILRREVLYDWTTETSQHAGLDFERLEGLRTPGDRSYPLFEEVRSPA
jgi:hypothetical protein